MLWIGPPTTTTLQESVYIELSPKKSAPGSKHAGSKKKGHHSEKLWPASLASQEDSQAGDRCVTRMAGVSQESTAESSRRHSWCKKKAKTHKEKKSSKLSSMHLQTHHSPSSFCSLGSLNKLMFHSLVLVIIELYVAILCSCYAKVWVINIFKYQEHQTIKQIYKGTVHAILECNNPKTKIVMQG